MLFPIDTSLAEAAQKGGYLEIFSESVVSDLDIRGRSGQTPNSGTKGLNALNEYFGAAVSEHAVNEMNYEDNYLSFSSGIYISVGGGPGDSLNKINYFDKADGNRLINDEGTGSTPIGSSVYVAGKVNFTSDVYETTDETDPYHYILPNDFDAQSDNYTEYNYLTALNILQKFDGEIYQPTGCSSPIVNEKVNLNSQTWTRSENGKTVFKIQTTETATSWSSTNPTKTQSYELTILYAAKPDGTNWHKATVSGDYDTGKNEQPNDGGTTEMDLYEEEDLIYFTTLEDLHTYFGGKGVCVAILYELRDCCIRTGRSVMAESLMKIPDDFQLIGDTYAITNDVRGWTTYRPDYKYYYKAGTRNDVIYQFNWADHIYKEVNGATAYGTTNGTTENQQPEGYAAGTYPSTRYATIIRRTGSPALYADGYVKSQYKNGFKAAGTHNGWMAGNNLLLYSLDSEITIGNTDKMDNSNSIKSQYNLSNGERIANFEVDPDVQVSTGITNIPLVENGSQPTDVEIRLLLPKHLNYQEGSVVFDYSPEECKYEEGDLNWEITKTTNADGSSVVTLKTTVMDIKKDLPNFKYSCVIGNPDGAASEDVANGTRLTTIAEIETTYMETGRITGFSHRDEVTIAAIKNELDSIYKSVDKKLYELGESISYTLNYKNEDAVSSQIRIYDILPYNGDNRGTSFTGGYRLTSVEIQFDTEDTVGYSSFKDNGVLRFSTTAVTDSLDEKTQKTIFENAEANWSLAESAKAVTDDAKGKVTYDLSDKDIIQLASDKGGKGLFLYIPSVGAKHSLKIHLTMSPVSRSGNQLIEAAGKVQEGGAVYANRFVYKNNEASPVYSGKVSLSTVARAIRGLAWMDQNKDGKYVTGSSDQVLSGVDVCLYTKTETLLQNAVAAGHLTKNADNTWTQKTGNSEAGDNADSGDGSGSGSGLTMGTITIGGVTYYPAVDILGNLIESKETGEGGAYAFDKLAQNDYIVVFRDADNDYSGNDILPFSKLSVTPERDTNIANSKPKYTTNKSEPYYEGTDSSTGLAPMVLAVITNNGSGIRLPAISSIQGIDASGTYVTNHWDAGFYYNEINVEKLWENTRSVAQGNKVTVDVTAVTKGLEAGAKVIYPTGHVAEEKSGVVLNSGYVFTQNDGTVGVAKIGGDCLDTKALPDPTNAVVDSNTGLMQIKWSLLNRYMQAEGSTGPVTYSFTETATTKSSDGADIPLCGYRIRTETEVDPETNKAVWKMANTQILYDIDITKQAEEADEAGEHDKLGNAQFTVFKDAACTQPLTLNGNDTHTSASTAGSSAINAGVAQLTNLEAGTWYVKETVAPSGYALSKAVYQVEIRYDQAGANAETDHTGSSAVRVRPIISVKQITDGATGKQLAAPIDVTDVSPDPTATETVGNTPDEQPVKYTIRFTVEDKRIRELPATGGNGIIWSTLGGIALMLAALYLMDDKKRRAYFRNVK